MGAIHRTDEEALEGDVSAGFVRNGKGDNVGQSLCLMDDSISVRQVPPVLYSDLTASHHPAQLLLDLVWTRAWTKKMMCLHLDQFAVLSEDVAYSPVTANVCIGTCSQLFIFPLKKSFCYGTFHLNSSLTSRLDKWKHKYTPTRRIPLFTLNMWIFSHEQQTPSQSSRCGISASWKQVGHCKYQVLLIVVSVLNTSLLRERTSTYHYLCRTLALLDEWKLQNKKNCLTSSFCIWMRKQSTRPLQNWGCSVSFRCVMSSFTSLTVLVRLFNKSCRFFVQLTSLGNML